MKTYEDLIDYLIKCCKNIVGENPKTDCKLEMNMATIQLAKMKMELEIVKDDGIDGLNQFHRELKNMVENYNSGKE